MDTMRATAAPLVGKSVTVCHQAGATGLSYVQHFAVDGTARGAIVLQRPEEIVAPPDAIIVGTGAASVSTNNRRAPEFDLPNAAAFAALASKLPVATTPLQPIYIREPDAKPQAQSVRQLPELRVSRVGAEAAALLAELHATGFASAWDARSITEMLHAPGTLALVAHTELTPAGFAILRAAAGEAEILTIVTAPSLRGRGVGRRLLDAGMAYLPALKVSEIFLEVAADNLSALKLYQHLGFRQSGLRKAYYQRTGEAPVDAIMMRRTVP
jgi:ribosomal-protein-alanine acetyltransferase